MFSIFRKKVTAALDLGSLRCDMHSHLIPGIDDGVPDMETSLQLIRGMIDLGYKKIITTPHIMWEMFKNTPEIIKTGCESVKKRLTDGNISIEFSAAAEYFLDDHFERLVHKDQPLLTIKNNLVMVEFSFVGQPIRVKEILFELQIKGYQPVIVHPERYMYFNHHKNWYDEMKDLGCLFQLNLLSLTGYYGKVPAELAQYLIRKKYINLIGTDLHNEYHLKMIRSSSGIIQDSVMKLLDTGMIQNPEL
jgi:protein-tyrosine phosphatase